MFKLRGISAIVCVYALRIVVRSMLAVGVLSALYAPIAWCFYLPGLRESIAGLALAIVSAPLANALAYAVWNRNQYWFNYDDPKW